MKQIYLLFLLIFSINTISSKDLPLLPTATISGGGITICQNSQGSLITFTGSGGTAPYTFTYRINTGASTTITTIGTDSSVTLPVNTATSGSFTYQLQSVSDFVTTTQTAVANASTIVQIIPQANADLNSTADSGVFDGFPVFKVCGNQPTQIQFINASTTVATNTSYTINWGDNSPNFTSATNWATINHNYPVGLWTITYSVTAQNGCNSTKIFKVFVGNNPAVGLENPGNTDICITSSLTFPITGTENNPLGTIYTVTFNDGSTPQVFSHPPPPSVTHIFLRTSCGVSSNIGTLIHQNSFYASIVAVNPCDQSAATVVPIRISTAPIANFSMPQPERCINTQVCFANTSTGGDSASSSTCATPKIVWSISPNTGYTLANGTLGNDNSGSINTNTWISGSSSICPIFSAPGNYSITMKIGNKCGINEITKTICIESPIIPAFTLTNNSGCAPMSVTANNTTVVSNSCTPPTYVWSVSYTSGNCGTTITPIPNQTTANAAYNFTVAGTYTVKLTATNSCGSANTIQTVVVKKPPTISAINGISSSYCGPSTINPTAAVTDCSPLTTGLIYDWSFPGGTPSSASTASTGAISYTTSGNHIVSLIVSNECGASAVFTKTVLINDVPTVTTAPLSQTICSGTTTTVVNLTSNISAATFTWTATATPGITGFVPSGSGNSIPIRIINTSDSASGTVTYVITPSISGCAGTPSNYVITVNPAPTIITQPSSSTVCQGGIPSVLTVALSSNSGTPTYQWYSNNLNNTTTGTIISGEISSSFNPPNNVIGTVYYYCVISLASGGCSSLISSVATVTIANSAQILNQPLATQNICVGSTIPSPLSVTHSGGTGTPTYQWYSNSTSSSTGGTLIAGAVSATYTPPVFTASGSTYYYVIITLSGNSCGSLISGVAEVTVNNDPTIATQPLNSQSVCQSAIPVNLEVIMSDATLVFLYQWYSNSANTSSGGIAISGATNNTFTPPTNNVGTKYYYCIISQNGTAGCAVTSAVATVIVNTAPNFTTQPLSNTYCLGQPASLLSVTYINGSGIPQYQWYSNTINSNLGGIAIASANAANFTPNGTLVGTLFYYCIITFPDLPGDCNTKFSNVAEIIIKPKPVIASQSITICSGAAFTIIPSSTGDIVPTGTTYTWSNPIINPAGAVSGAFSQAIPQINISQSLINATASPAIVTYTVTPTVGTCAGSAFTIIVTVNPSTNPNAVQVDVTCFGANNGSIITNITGGIPFSSGAPYAIIWTGPNGFTSSNPNISGLSPGLYTLSITDAGGCPISNDYTILEPSDIIIATDINTNITCFGSANGAISITVSGGTGSYNYSWTKNGLPFSILEDISNLGAGDYIVSVTDTNNCGPKTAVFSIIEPPILSLSLVSQINIDCFGASTGAINVNAVGGTVASDYNYLWSGPNGFSSPNQNLTNLFAGTYNLILTDDLGCNKSLEVIITESTPIIISAVTTPIVCYGDNNATIAVSIVGGNSPYQAQWNNLAVGLNQDNLSPGDYTITVTDILGCQKELTINIPSPPIFTVNPVISDISCFGAHDGSIVLNFVGGILPVNLVWSDGSRAGTTRNNLGPGTYSVTITDSKPCTISRNFIIIEPQPLVLSANNTNALNCSNANSGAIDLMVSGGTPPFIYSWNNGNTTEDLLNIPAGNYAVTVTDSKLCTKTAQYSITRPNPILLSVATTTNADCNAEKVSQNFSAQVSGGLPPYQFIWSDGIVSGSNNEFMTTTQNGLVVLTATDAIGCTAIYSLNVDIPVINNSDFSASSIAYSSYGIYSISDPIEFTSTITGDYINVLWDFGDGTFSNELNPVHTYSIPKNYLVTQTVTYPFGCVYVNHLPLIVEKGYLLVVPTAFTPGNDGMNDNFRPVTRGLKKIHLYIYDTWGSLIYSEVGDVIKGWNGKIKDINSENGNYYAKVSAETFYGTIVSSNQAIVLIK